MIPKTILSIRHHKHYALPCVVCFFASLANLVAKVELPTIFTDHMVVQQKQPVRLWGQAKPETTVTASLAGEKGIALADMEGRFVIELPALDARRTKGAQQLVVSDGDSSITIDDILVGEVWLCSGQSNMLFPLSKADHGDDAIAQANHPQIRFFQSEYQASENPESTIPGSAWAVCAPETAADFSAVGYFFALKVQEALDVPVGLIGSYKGGTPIETWAPLWEYASNPQIKPILDFFDELLTRADEAEAEHQSNLQQWRAKNAQAQAEGREFNERKPTREYGLREQYRPGYLYNGMIAPVMPYPLAGVLWYQGEHNANRSRGNQYQALLGVLIQSWRKGFEREYLPFGVVQLPNYKRRAQAPSDSGWAELRESQLKVAQSDSNVGLVVIIDSGDARDIHPTNKLVVGNRLAAWALADVYKVSGVVGSGPIYESMTIKDGKAVVTFDKVYGGLQATGGKVKGFAIAGEDREFVWADAVIKGQTVVVSSPAVPNPVAIRYAWADNPEATLYNTDGLPASPFRTDTWPSPTDDN